MEISQKKKNIIDLEYGALLNKLNIFLIIIGTILVTFWFNFKIWWSEDPIPNFLFKIDVTLAILVITLLIYIIINSKLKEMTEKISEL